jgi:hypothetical protein
MDNFIYEENDEKKNTPDTHWNKISTRNYPHQKKIEKAVDMQT